MFTKVRIKLTSFYLLIVVVILVAFSLLLFYHTAQHIRDNFEDNSESQSVQNAIAESALDQLQRSILIGDSVVIVLAGLLSYWLAGKTLKPIHTALDAQEQFSAHASHELRTPLSVVKTDLEVFLKKKQPKIEDARATVLRSLEEIDRMSGMIENLLILARSKKVGTPVELKDVDIAKVINSVVKKLQRSAEAKNLSLTFLAEDATPIIGNEKLLEQLFFNLIQNAITYTKTGSITITVAAEDTAVTVEIKDTGIGINKEELAHIFKPFYKTDISRADNSDGVGLGLSIVKEIVDKHKGSIKIDSELNKGTKITVTLPISIRKMS